MRNVLVNHMVCNQSFNSTGFNCNTYAYISTTEDFVTYLGIGSIVLVLICFLYDYVKQNNKPKLILPKWQV